MKKLIEHITGKRLMERWNYDEHELFQIVRSGLPVYRPCDALEPLINADKFLKLGIDTSNMHFKPDYIDKFGNLFKCAFPDKPQEIPFLIFKLSDIELFEIETKGSEAKKVFPCKPGTRWKDVEITLTSYETVIVKTPQGTGRFHFSELNFSDKRSGDKFTKLWTLLSVFCKYSGRITSETQVKIKNLDKSISDLNKKLQSVFGINESLYHEYNNKNGWVSKCVFNDNTE